MAAARPAAQGSGSSVTVRRLILVGGGEHALVVADAARSSGAWELVGFADPGPAERIRALLAIDHLGDDDALAARLAATPPGDRPWLVVALGAIGDAAARRAIAARFADARWATIVHSTAVVSPAADVLPGAVVLAGAIVNAGTSIGRHAIVNTGAVVEHDVVLGAFAQVGPGATIGGGVTIGDDAFIGLGASIRDHVAIGERAIVGMGAVVVADVARATTVVGVPARRRDQVP